MGVTLIPRQYGSYRNCTQTEDGFIDEDSCYVPFWSTKTGVIVKWSLFLAICVAFTLYLLIGYIHAKKRIQRGLPPLSYHRVRLKPIIILPPAALIDYIAH